MSLWSINIQQKRQEHTMKSVSSINGVGKTGLVHAKKNWTRPSYTICQNKLKMDKRLNYTLWYHKNPRGKEEVKFQISHIAIFSLMYLLVQGKQRKVNKWDYIKFKNFCTAEKNSSKWNRNQLYGRTYLPMILWTRVQSPKYIKNLYDSTARR